jgi:hypothetical protein
MKDEDLFNALKYLDRRGKVKFDGIDFLEIQSLRRQIKDGKKISSITFTGVSARDAVSRLAFISGKRLRIQKGDSQQNVSVSMKDATLNEILARISETGHVTIRR